MEDSSFQVIHVDRDDLVSICGILCFATGWCSANANLRNTLLHDKIKQARDMVMKYLNLDSEAIFNEDKQETGSY